jgi:hypothetical protein
MSDTAIPGWPEAFRSSNRLTFGRDPSLADAAWWHNRFFEPHGLQPLDMAELLCRHAPGEKRFHYRYLTHIDESFELEVTGTSDSGRIWFHSPVLELRRDWFLWDRIERDPGSLVRGVAKALASDLYGVVIRLGLSAIRMPAEDVGGYLWARAGFVPDAGSWPAVQQHMVGRLVRLARHVSAERFMQVNNLLAKGQQAPHLIHAIALLRDPVPLTDAGDRQEQELGKALLIGSNWVGTLELGNRLSRDRFEEWISQ